jgi:hypothetical protein
MSQDHYTGMLDHLNNFGARQSNKSVAANNRGENVVLVVGGASSLGVCHRGCLIPDETLFSERFKYHVTHVRTDEVLEVMQSMTARDLELFSVYADRGFMLSNGAYSKLYGLHHPFIFEAWLRRMVYLTPFVVSETVHACLLHKQNENARVGLGSLLTKMWHHEMGLVRHAISYLFEPEVDWNYVQFYDRVRDGGMWMGNDKIIYTPVPPSMSVKLPNCKRSGSEKYHSAICSLSMHVDCEDVAPHEAELLLAATRRVRLSTRLSHSSLETGTKFLRCELTPHAGSDHIPNYTFTWQFQTVEAFAYIYHEVTHRCPG